MQAEAAVRSRAREKFEAIRALDEIDVPPLEPALADLLDFVQQHPEAADGLKTEFLVQLELLDCDVWWAIAYCMHTLRWPEVRDEVARQVAYLVRFREAPDAERRRMRDAAPAYMTDLRRWNVVHAILESFETDWRDRDFFITYGGPPARG